MRRRTTYVQALLSVALFFLFHGFLVEALEPVVAPMEKKEQEALYSAIQGFVGKWWNGSELYPDPCGWTPLQGVSCDLFNGLWYITVLNIGPVLDNSLECAPDAHFSPQLYELKHLKSLSFYNCFSLPHQPTIPIPSTDWYKLASSLETLEFRSNAGLTGPVPAGIGQLTNLRSLVLVENGLSGELPPELGNLTNLRRLVLSANRLSGQIPATLGSLSSLLKLDLSSNLLHGNLPPELGLLRNLTLLDLRNNSFTGGLAAGSLHNLVALQDLLLSNNPLGGSLTDMVGWEGMANLTTLDLSNLGLVGSIPESITSLRRLRFLALDHNNLSGAVPRELAALPDLSALYLNGNNLTGRLDFTSDFYERMGRRFASWSNPNLCYSSVSGAAPIGVEQCKGEEAAAVGVRSKGESRNRDENPSSGLLTAASGRPAVHVYGFWWVVAVQELVAAFLLAMLL